ncbi:MAG TPA: hypothetical protein VMP86_07070, partial [Candidatus Binatia bacterium]|nr:hypothetical protein [Candidatus Binatia bacterium]
MTRSAKSDVRAATAASPPAPTRSDPARRSAPEQPVERPRSREEAEERYVVARDAWIKAMRVAEKGRPAGMAALAIAQEAFEAATAEREGWIAGRVAIQIHPEGPRTDLEAVVAQEMAWRRVHAHEQPTGFFE